MNRLNSEVLREIGTLSRSIHSISDNKFKELNLQKGQFIYLTRICEHPGINFIDLTVLLKIDKTSTTKAIQKLEAEGYIERKKDLNDKRVIRLYPTKKGLESYDYIIDQENKNIETCFKDFSEDDKSIVIELIMKMSKNIEAEWKASKMILGGHEND
ncbi:MarR family transcriptional regulator [Clostridium zeae]|uniref:MarR family transcriptional regulator n=1 Tax=Clostridium zeae TaxID=2759022 RepID=A0ABQ1EBT2_9CLOT|nr:MarR family transcriptional regulator [Clostridium zeae]GFZ32230.1 MarR family transcriptional regulator [Clostridium zeae]